MHCFHFGSLIKGLSILQSKLLKKAVSMLLAESEAKKREKEKAVNESFPPLQMSGLSVQELQVLAQRVLLI